jgi:hypothetical protein
MFFPSVSEPAAVNHVRWGRGRIVSTEGSCIVHLAFTLLERRASAISGWGRGTSGYIHVNNSTFYFVPCELCTAIQQYSNTLSRRGGIAPQFLTTVNGGERLASSSGRFLPDKEAPVVIG